MFFLLFHLVAITEGAVFNILLEIFWHIWPENHLCCYSYSVLSYNRTYVKFIQANWNTSQPKALVTPKTSLTKALEQ